jgi:tRNA G18 (ribose-2'-O)-methylase SpoU
MAIVPIFDASDSRLGPFLHLTDVDLRSVREPRDGIFLAEGRLVIERAVATGYVPIAAATSPRWTQSIIRLVPEDVPIYELPIDVLRAVTGYRVHRGALAVFARRALPNVAELLAACRRIVLLEDLIDHTNVGAIIRSAAGLGFDGLIVSPACADPLYRRSVKVSMGAALALPWARSDAWIPDLELVRQAGFDVVALAPGARRELGDLHFGADARVALLFGTEGAGLSADTLRQVTEQVAIPMSGGVDSLNVAVAAGIACYALRR